MKERTTLWSSGCTSGCLSKEHETLPECDSVSHCPRGFHSGRASNFSSRMIVNAFQWGSLFLFLLLCKRRLLKWKLEDITSLLKRPWWLPTPLRVKAKSPARLDQSFCSDFTFDHSPPCSLCSPVALLLLNLSQHVTPRPPEPVPSHPLSGHPSPSNLHGSFPFQCSSGGSGNRYMNTRSRHIWRKPSGEERGPRGSRKRHDGGKLLTIKWPQAWFFG